MSGKDLGAIVAFTMIVFGMGVGWQKAASERDMLRHRIEVLEHVTVSEHPEYSAAIFP